MKQKKQSPRANPAPDPDIFSEEKPGLKAGGQSGDTQGLSSVAEADSESVEELVEEGQFFEAAVVSGVENAPDADVAEVRTHEVPEDDVPSEYLEHPPDEPKE
jgi:N utilization substance protein A